MAVDQRVALEDLQVLAEPLRWRVVVELARSDRRVGELCALLERPQNLVSYHVGQLRAAGLVTSRRSSADGRDRYYRIDLERCSRVLAAAGAAIHPGVRLEAADPPSPSRRGRRPRVLFLCTGNSARSQIAEALTRHRSHGRVVAHSAGSHPKPVHPLAVRVLAERGIDISDRTSTHLRSFARRRVDHVITLCDKVREVCPGLPGQPETAHWSIPDPSQAGGPDDADTSWAAFAAVADEIEARVDLLLAQLAAEDPAEPDHSATRGTP